MRRKDKQTKHCQVLQMGLLDKIASATVIHSHPHAIYYLSAPSSPFTACPALLKLDSKYFSSWHKLSFVSKGHWRRKRFALLVQFFFFWSGSCSRYSCICSAHCPAARSTYPWAGNKAAELPPAHSLAAS